ncbi:MAG TPA: peptide MFS transporter [Steroidobacteraceae bacterium]|nr:peptide MFS transporter [Steroidobacteraceae bacterium]
MNEPSATPVVTADPGKQFFGHPRGLVTCFMVEFFERFTYYGMRSMLVLFLASPMLAANPGFGVDGATAGAVYALFTGGAYLLAIPGGWIADRLIGQRKAIFIGGLLIAAGNFILAIPATPAVFYSGVFVMVLGIGLLKPNVSSVVGALYEGQPGARRDAGFSIFYMGINLGATIGPLTASALGEKVNWHLGFLVCGIATLAGTLYFLYTQRYLGEAGRPPLNVTPVERKRTWTLLVGIAVAAAVLALTLFTREHPPTEHQLAIGLFGVQVALAVFFFGYVLLSKELDSAAKKKIGVIIVFFFCAILFWGGFEQQGTTFNTFAFDYTDRSFLGGMFADGQHPATWYQSVNPAFIIVLAPVFAWIWVSLGARNLDPSAPTKMGMGLVLLGVGFLVMMLAAQLVVSSGGRVGPTWLVLAYLFHTFGELCLSPVGLSNVTKLAPAKYVSRMMGTWFLGTAMGNTIAGLVGGQFAEAKVEQMPHIFLVMTLIGAGAGVFILLISRGLRSWIGDAK